MRSRVGARGRVTIPKALRDQLGIKPGQVLDFEVDGERLVAGLVNRLASMNSAYGILELPGSTDDFMAELRGL